MMKQNGKLRNSNVKEKKREYPSNMLERGESLSLDCHCFGMAHIEFFSLGNGF